MVFFFSAIFLGIYLYILLINNYNSYFILILSFILALISIVRPNTLYKPNLLWFKFGIILGKIFSPLILGLIFFIIITPIAFFMKLIQRDALKLKKSKENSFWEKYENNKINMKNQY